VIFNIQFVTNRLTSQKRPRKKKCDNNVDSSYKEQANKFHSLETKLDILKRIDNGERFAETASSSVLACSAVSTTAENRVKIVEQVKSAGTIQAILVNPKRSVVTQQMEHLLRIWLDDQAYRCRQVSQATLQPILRA
jgi:hypothetical protein